MAIYSVSESYNTDDVLDNMLEACDQMMSAIGESGGAHQRYAKMLADKDEELANELKKTEPRTYKSENLNNKRAAIAKKFDKYVSQNNRGVNASTQYSGMQRDKNYNPGTYASTDYAIAKQQFKANFGNRGIDKLKDKKPGSVLAAQEAKKKAIKETCLNILSVIDEL